MKTQHALLFLAAIGTSFTTNAAPNERALAVSKYWTAERMAAAQPRDFALDHRGLAYLKGKGGVLKPYGHNVPATPEPMAKGGKGGGGGKPGGGDSGGGDTGGTGFVDVKNSPWTNGGHVQNAAGRIYFVMEGSGYVCSGTLINDGETESDRSIVLTAAHCVYDDINKKFAQAAIFIPNQANTTGTVGTDGDCSNDPLGCYVIDYGVVSEGWSQRTFPDNIPWDYAFFALGTNEISPDADRFSNVGNSIPLDRRDNVTPMEISFAEAEYTLYTRALGYSYSDDPNFMYCGEPLTGAVYDPDGYLLPNCGMSGGASGGPWSQSQDLDLGTGPIFSVNSYGPARGKSYMGGPNLNKSDASCLFDKVKTAPSDQTEGIVTTCSN